MTVELSTRARLRSIEPGNRDVCVGCNREVKFNTRDRTPQVIANVYENGRWNRKEHWHLRCYEEADQPHGEATP